MKELKYALDGGCAPVKAHDADAGIDLRSPWSVVIEPNDSVIIDTGVHVAIPEGYVGFLKSKSGLNMKHGIVGTGVIDAGYTGSIVVKLYNLSSTPYSISYRDKIIQLVILPIETPKLVMTTLDEITEFGQQLSDRNEGGFGSTGK